MSTRHTIGLAVLSLGVAAFAKELICDNHNWISCCTFSGTILPGSELPGQIPELATTGIVWVPDNAYEFAGARGPDRTVDAVTLTYAQFGPTVTHTNFALDPDNRQVQIPWTVTRPHMSIAHFVAIDGPILIEMSYKVPHVILGFGQTTIEYKLTNVTNQPVQNVRLLRSLNPKIQRNAEIPVEILQMDLVSSGSAGIAVHPSGATLLLGSPGNFSIASIEGDIVTDPLEIIGSPRDPDGLLEDTAINIVLNPVQLLPGQTFTGTMLLITAEDPLTAIEAFNSGGVKFCLPDCEGDGDLDVFDYLCFLNAFAAQDPYADFENDGDWDVFDFLAFQNAFALGCP